MITLMTLEEEFSVSLSLSFSLHLHKCTKEKPGENKARRQLLTPPREDTSPDTNQMHLELGLPVFTTRRK